MSDAGDFISHNPDPPDLDFGLAYPASDVNIIKTA
jgi:hypothetical protein